jgi:hypothetical protein
LALELTGPLEREHRLGVMARCGVVDLAHDLHVLLRHRLLRQPGGFEGLLPAVLLDEPLLARDLGPRGQLITVPPDVSSVFTPLPRPQPTKAPPPRGDRARALVITRKLGVASGLLAFQPER